MKFLLKIFLILAFSTTLQAQEFRGRVMNSLHQSIEYTSIYIPELMQAFSTNEDGTFDIKLSEGEYTCVFRHPLYEMQTLKITIPTNNTFNIILNNLQYRTDTTFVENIVKPADAIMRQVIIHAPFYKNQVMKYTSNLYMRTDLQIYKLGGAAKALSNKRFKQIGVEEGNIFMSETLGEIKYDRGKYDRTILARTYNTPDTLPAYESINDVIINIYEEASEWFTSPLAEDAFNRYNFAYNGYFLENGKRINKIYIVPRNENTQHLSGYICFVDGTWQVHSFDLSLQHEGVISKYTGTFDEILPDVYMPTFYHIYADAAVANSNGSLNKLITFGYSDIELLAKNLESYIATASTYMQMEYRVALEVALKKMDISTEKAIQARMMLEKFNDEKILVKDFPGRGKYEIIDNSFKVSDSVNKEHGNEYWSENRTIPFSANEDENIFRMSDTLRAAYKIIQQRRAKLDNISKLIFGGTFQLDPLTKLHYGGALDNKAYFNAVDRLTIGQTATLEFTDEYGAIYEGEGKIAYSFGRKQPLWKLGFSYGYLPEKRGKVYIKVGNQTVDFNEYNGVSPVTNELSSLFLKKNYINYYGKQFIEIGNNIDFLNGFSLAVNLSYQKRKHLNNTTHFSIFKGGADYRSNDPVNPYIEKDSTILADSKAFVLDVEVSYTPCQYYKMQGRKKVVVKSDFPTFALNWRRGLSGVLNSVSNFDLLTLKISHSLDLGLSKSIKYGVRLGKFFNNKEMHFSEFAHFNMSEDDFFFGPFEGMQKLMQTYYSSTNDWFMQANFTYSAPSLLIPPFLLNKFLLMQENLYFTYLKTPYMRHFWEVGYGLSNIFKVFGIGVFAGFEEYKYKFTRLKISFDI